MDAQERRDVEIIAERLKSAQMTADGFHRHIENPADVWWMWQSSAEFRERVPHVASAVPFLLALVRKLAGEAT